MVTKQTKNSLAIRRLASRIHIYFFVFLLALGGIVFGLNKFFSYKTYAFYNGECINMQSSTKAAILSGRTVTYECFGAQGNGSTNDYAAIKNTHDFANEVYIEEGILLTVQGTSGKTYYLGDNHVGNYSNPSPISVITNVDWRGANFIVDDYGNGAASNLDLFRVVSPMTVMLRSTKTPDQDVNAAPMYDYRLNSYSVDVTSIAKMTDVDNNATVRYLDVQAGKRGSLDASLFVGAVKAASSFAGQSSSMTETIHKYLSDARIWAVQIEDENVKQYIRYSGTNTNSGSNERDVFLIDTETKTNLSDIEWSFNMDSEKLSVRIWPVPENPITIKNGNFTTKVNHDAFYLNNGKCANQNYNNRNIRIAFTGNVTISGVKHYLDENAYTGSGYSYTCYYSDSNPLGNAYYGFVRLDRASYINVNNVDLTPHTTPIRTVTGSTSSYNYGTYDLVYNYSTNVQFNNLSFACASGSKTRGSSCYEEMMIEKSKWGLVESSGSRNVFFTNSQLNRIDAHEGVMNLYVTDSTIGAKGFRLIGSGDFYANNLLMDRSPGILQLREDYGSTWNGTVVMDDITFTIPNNTFDSSTIYLVKSGRQYTSSLNDNTHDFGYLTYFPNLYLNNITLDNTGKYNGVTLNGADTNTKDIYLARLNSDNVDLDGGYKYDFAGDIRVNNIKFVNQNGRTFYATTDGFADGNALETNAYRTDTQVKIGYYDLDSTFQKTSKIPWETQKTPTDKFYWANSSSFPSIIANKSSAMASAMTTQKSRIASEISSMMPDDFYLSGVTGITLNESISTSRTEYTATVPRSTSQVNVGVTTSGEVASLTCNGSSCPATIYLTGETATLEITLVGMYGENKVYTVTIAKEPAPSLIPVDIPTAGGYCLSTTYTGYEQSLTKSPGEGYTFSNNFQTISGRYMIVATLSSGYQWSDGTTTSKSFYCTMDSATTTITANKTSATIEEGSSTTVTFSANTSGEFRIESKSTTVATVAPSTITANAGQSATFTINGANPGNTTVEMSFTPSDSVNWTTPSKKIVDVMVLEVEPELKTAIIPTSGEYCRPSSYSSAWQDLTYEPGEGYVFNNPYGKDAGNYEIEAVLEEGYEWNDGTQTIKIITCSIAKATPRVTLSSSSGEVEAGSSLTFSESASVAGAFSNTSQNTGVATVSPASTGVAANAEQEVNVHGVSKGTTTITVNFTPTDTANYNSPSAKTFTIGVSLKVATIPDAANYCRALVYTGAEQTLTFEAGEGYVFSGNNQTNAGNYTITASLLVGYEWSDGRTTDKTFVCSISKAMPSVSTSLESITLAIGEGELGFTEIASVPGSFSNSSSNTAIVRVRPQSSGLVAANTEVNLYAESASTEGNTTLTITFTPEDTTNYSNPNPIIVPVTVNPSESKVATIPTTSSYCRALIYNGTEQVLTFSPGEGYSFSGNTGIGAGKYTVVASLAEGYVWNDETVADKTFNCSIEKATPSFNLNKSNTTIKEGDSSTVVATSNVAGTLSLGSSNGNVATVSPESIGVEESVETFFTIFGVGSGEAIVHADFVPLDTANFSTLTRRNVSVVVVASEPELKIATIPTDSYCKNLTYNRQAQTLTSAPGEGYDFSSNTAVDAGSYNVVASLKSGYKWSDETTENKIIVCSIAKAVPGARLQNGDTIKNFDDSMWQVEFEHTSMSFVLTEMTDVSGTFYNISSGSEIAKFEPTENSVTANSQKTTIITSVSPGETTLKIRFEPEDSANYQTLETGDLLVSVADWEDKSVTIPTSENYCKDIVYNGLEQNLINEPAEGYRFENTTGINAGNYDITASLLSGYKWSDGTTTNKTITCSIEKLATDLTLGIETGKTIVLTVGDEFDFTESANADGVFRNTSANPDVLAVSPAIVEGASAGSMVDVTATAQGVGITTLTVQFTPTDTDNYTGGVSETVQVVIRSAGTRIATIPTEEDYCSKPAYTGEAQLVVREAGEGYNFLNQTGTNAGNYTVIAQLKNGYEWRDGTTEDKTLTCSIEKAMPEFWVNTSVLTIEVGGSRNITESASVEGSFSQSSSDAMAFSVAPGVYMDVNAREEKTFSVSGLKVGEGFVTVSFNPRDTENYLTPEEITVQVTVREEEPELEIATIPTSEEYCQDLTYNGWVQTLVSEAGEGYWFDNTVGMNAGDYTVTAILSDGYEWDDETIEDKTIVCKIKKAMPIFWVNFSEVGVEVGKNKEIVENADVDGMFRQVSSDTTLFGVTPEEHVEVEAEDDRIFYLLGVKAGEGQVTVSFIPSDTENYLTPEDKIINVTVSEEGEPVTPDKPEPKPDSDSSESSGAKTPDTGRRMFGLSQSGENNTILSIALGMLVIGTGCMGLGIAIIAQKKIRKQQEK